MALFFVSESWWGAWHPVLRGYAVTAEGREQTPETKPRQCGFDGTEADACDGFRDW